MSEAGKYGLTAAVIAGAGFAGRAAVSATPLGKLPFLSLPLQHAPARGPEQSSAGAALCTSALVIAGMNLVGFVITAITQSHKITDLTACPVASLQLPQPAGCSACSAAALEATMSHTSTGRGGGGGVQYKCASWPPAWLGWEAS